MYGIPKDAHEVGPAVGRMLWHQINDPEDVIPFVRDGGGSNGEELVVKHHLQSMMSLDAEGLDKLTLIEDHMANGPVGVSIQVRQQWKLETHEWLLGLFLPLLFISRLVDWLKSLFEVSRASPLCCQVVVRANDKVVIPFDQLSCGRSMLLAIQDPVLGPSLLMIFQYPADTATELGIGLDLRL